MGLRHRLLLTALTGGYAASLTPGWRRYRAALRDPARAQDDLLRSVIEECRDSVQGVELSLGGVGSLAEYQDRVPIRTYADYAPYIDRIARGEHLVLTRSPVQIMERSSGSTGKNKLIPYTRRLLDDFSAATAPWLFSMYARRPELLGTTSYWSVSPAARARETTSGGIPIGFEDDTEYFGPVARWALARILSVPGSVARVQDLESWRRLTLRHLLEDEDLGFISVWSPTFLTLLFEALETQLQDILPELTPARHAQIDRGLDAAGRVTGQALWPRLRLISCWTEGHAARFVTPLRRAFEGVEIQPKGLLATEGVISFPLCGARGDPAVGGVAALTSHLIELIDLEHPDARPVPVHRARIGARYTPLMSTHGGLLRYRLGDAVRCVGYLEGAPRFCFEGRLDRTSDLCGEKVTVQAAEHAVAAAENAGGIAFDFALLCPDLRASPPRYRLFVEAELSSPRSAAAAAAAEAALMTQHHYAYARDLGQLGALAITAVTRGAHRYEAALVARGVRAGDIKPTALDNQLFWTEVFD